jgi:branched-chain amino acid transport system permease protein
VSRPAAPPIRFALAAAVGAALVYLASVGLNPYQSTILQFVGINVILAVSLNITNGFVGLFSLGHPAFMTIGGYVTAILTMTTVRKGIMLPDLPQALVDHEWSFLPALLAAGLTAAVAALGLIFIVQSFAVNLSGFTRGALGLSGLPALTSLWWVYLMLLATLYVCWQVKHSSLGRTMLAIRENELAAACLGVQVARVRVLAFGLGAFFAGIAGGLWVHLVTLISPGSFTFLLAFQLVVMVVIGGAGSITGAALAAAALTIAGELLRPVEEAANLFGASQIIVAVGVILVLIYRPTGLFGAAEPNALSWLMRSTSRQDPEAGSKS